MNAAAAATSARHTCCVAQRTYIPFFPLFLLFSFFFYSTTCKRRRHGASSAIAVESPARKPVHSRLMQHYAVLWLAESSDSVDSSMNAGEGDSRCWNFIQIAGTTHVSVHVHARRFLLASTSRKFSPPTRSPPCSAKFAGKSSQPPCIHSRRPVYVTVGAVQEPPPITPIPRRPCFIVYERLCFIHLACQSDFQSCRDSYKSLRRSNFADLTVFSRYDGYLDFHVFFL